MTPVKLRGGGDCLHGCLIAGQAVTGNEEIVVVHVAIHVSGNFGSLGAEGWTSTFEEDYENHAPNAGVGVGGEPAVAGSRVRAGSRLAEDFFFVEVHAQAARGAVLHGSSHAVGEFRNRVAVLVLPFPRRVEVGDLFGRGRMLQVV